MRVSAGVCVHLCGPVLDVLVHVNLGCVGKVTQDVSVGRFFLKRDS